MSLAEGGVSAGARRVRVDEGTGVDQASRRGPPVPGAEPVVGVLSLINVSTTSLGQILAALQDANSCVEGALSQLHFIFKNCQEVTTTKKFYPKIKIIVGYGYGCD